MKCYLIDYENVKEAAFSFINELTKEDVVCMFYTQNCNKVCLDKIEKLINSEAKIILKKAKAGKNALDFQLASYLGYLISCYGDQEYIIVSKDKGYEVLLEFWKEYHITLFTGETKENKVNKKKEELTAKVSKVVEGEDVDTVVNIILEHKNKLAINNALVKQFKSNDNKKASAIYKAIKPIL